MTGRRKTKEDNMIAMQSARHEAPTETGLDFDVIVIGAGVAGLYQLYKLRELG